MPAKFELIAPCFFGCESTAKFELTRIGAENIRVEDGRLSFCGGAEMIAAANLNLRTVERVMLLLARYKAATFDELFDGVYSIPWEEFLPADAAFPVTGSSLNSQLTSSESPHDVRQPKLNHGRGGVEIRCLLWKRRQIEVCYEGPEGGERGKEE